MWLCNELFMYGLETRRNCQQIKRNYDTEKIHNNTMNVLLLFQLFTGRRERKHMKIIRFR